VVASTGGCYIQVVAKAGLTVDAFKKHCSELSNVVKQKQKKNKK
jgi:hypothetical protein